MKKPSHRKLQTPEMGRLSPDDYRRATKLPLVVVLDDVRSLHNVGAVFRTADAFRLEGLCLCGITATPPHPELHKTALGAEDCVEWRYYATALEAVCALREAGFTVLCLEQTEGSISLEKLHRCLGPQHLEPEEHTRHLGTEDPPTTQTADTPQPTAAPHYALVVGNEVHGVHQEVVDASHACLEIPQFGTKHSLNVSVATGMAIWQMFVALVDNSPQTVENGMKTVENEVKNGG